MSPTSYQTAPPRVAATRVPAAPNAANRSHARPITLVGGDEVVDGEPADRLGDDVEGHVVEVAQLDGDLAAAQRPPGRPPRFVDPPPHRRVEVQPHEEQRHVGLALAETGDDERPRLAAARRAVGGDRPAVEPGVVTSGHEP